MNGSDDRELGDLLRSAIAGDERSYARFLERVARRVRSYVSSRTAQGGIDPEDVVQETLLAIHLKRHTWMPDSAVLPWVLTIARHKLIDAYRRRGRRMEVDLDHIAETYAQPDVETVSERDIGRALASLAPGPRTVVAAISVEGRSIKETAQQLGMKETAVRVALHRGLAAIARRFGRD
ncbi:sigma-70 family RNA polymerase sigma factor [Ancylobacter dichloromethanicus]|uniref:RNA polymerase sigma factor n=1 Tax=Ancylobacter dichloromethanicus TaxID=518825 RepID=A0A9W6N0P3_9HYPH|nr:sigma-70 family RNA polymerase sigma factor [Ancylobacter dichloromethanicus]MBS7554995.1 sigma-70 family RNA polymerase sigma factor [Ancylobacter dichloromethanicus]GLK73393.1 RNA polymerase sigma factor [Ancylobacter dichloromethanicus]